METNNQTSFIQKLKALKQTVRFSAAQKQTMRTTLSEYADMHTVMKTATSRRVSISAFFFSRAFIAGTLIFVLVIGSGVGVTYAAGNSLPGEPLYGVKVNVAEPIQGALITSTAGKADWQNELAERRLDEGATLAAENKLSSSTQQYLEQQTSLHIAASEQDSDKLADSGNTDGALAVRSDLEARLSAHTRLLAILDARLQADGDATTTGEVALFLQNVSEDQTVVSLSREASEDMNASSTASSTPSERAKIAFDAQQDSDRRSEEAHVFTLHASILALLPAATSTASTTSSTTSSKGKHNRGKGKDDGGNDNATSTPSDDSTTASSSADINLGL